MKDESKLTKKEQELIKKYETKRPNTTFSKKKDMYLEQTDKNYKDGDRN